MREFEEWREATGPDKGVNSSSVRAVNLSMLILVRPVQSINIKFSSPGEKKCMQNRFLGIHLLGDCIFVFAVVDKPTKYELKS